MKELAKIILEIGAVKFDPVHPFVWSSGYRMPVYTDSRLLLGDYRHRELVAKGFRYLIDSNSIQYDIIFGVATAGISPATTLADTLKAPLGYVRPDKKDHGLGKHVEGPDSKGRTVLLIEELISTGRSSAKAVQALRKEGADVHYCLSIFNYGFDEANGVFDGDLPFDKNYKLATPCKILSLLDYDILLDTAVETGYVDKAQAEVLRNWRRDPFRLRADN